MKIDYRTTPLRHILLDLVRSKDQHAPHPAIFFDMKPGLARNFSRTAIIAAAFTLSSLLALYISGNKLDMPAPLAAIVGFFQTPLKHFDALEQNPTIFNEEPVPPTENTFPETEKRISARPKTARSAGSDNHGAEYQCTDDSSPTGIQEVNNDAIYRWTDDEGKTHFSDTPPSDYANQVVSSTKKHDFFNLKISYPAGLNGENLRDKIGVGGRAIYMVYARYLPFDLMTKSTIDVQIFSDKRSYDRFKLKYAPSVASTVDGFYSSSNNLATVSSHKSPARTLAISLHEISHAIHSGNFGRTPKWYNEGMAEVFENIQTAGSLISIPPNTSWASSLGHTQPIMELSKLLESTPKDWNGPGRNTYYANAWSLAFYLMQPKNTAFMGLLQAALTQERCNALDTLNFINSNYQGGVRALERDWRRWIQNGPFDSLRF